MKICAECLYSFRYESDEYDHLNPGVRYFCVESKSGARLTDIVTGRQWNQSTECRHARSAEGFCGYEGKYFKPRKEVDDSD